MNTYLYHSRGLIPYLFTNVHVTHGRVNHIKSSYRHCEVIIVVIAPAFICIYNVMRVSITDILMSLYKGEIKFSVNIVLRKPAFQSSTVDRPFTTSDASNANDGDFRTNWDHDRACSHTEQHPGSWWAVDLLRNYTIVYVTLTNRVSFGLYAAAKSVLPWKYHGFVLNSLRPSDAYMRQ